MFETATSTSYPAYSHDQVTQAIHDLGVISKENQDLQRIIDDLRASINSFTKIIQERDLLLSNAKALILEAYDIDDFSEDRVEAIAEALDIELTKEVNVVINVTFSGSVTVPVGFDIEGDLENYVNFEAESSGWGTSDVEVDLFTDGVDVNVVG